MLGMITLGTDWSGSRTEETYVHILITGTRNEIIVFFYIRLSIEKGEYKRIANFKWARN